VSISYRIDLERGLTAAVWDGQVTADDFLNHARRIIADPAWPAGEHHLTDLRTATLDSSIDDAVLKRVADLYGKHPKIPNLRVAVVAGDEFEKAGLFERYIARYRPFLFVFNSLNPACAWLGLDAREITKILDEIRRGESA
jgi:hypothetical protein